MRFFGLSLAALFVAASPAACSSSDPGTSVTLDAGAYGDDAGSADDSSSDDGPGDATPIACPPGDVSSFHPSWVMPAALHRNVCVQTQIDSYYAACLDGQTDSMADCTAFANANPECLACLYSSPVASPRGATYEPQTPDLGIVFVNTSGCVAAEQNDPNGNGCGGQIQAVTECGVAACTQCTTLSDFNGCLSAAYASVCSSWQSASDSCAKMLTGTAAMCTVGTTFQQDVSNVGAIFCGP